MRKIISEFSLGNYKVLILDGDEPKHRYNKYRIDGKYYNPVPIYDAKKSIAIISSDSFVGKTVYFDLV